MARYSAKFGRQFPSGMIKIIGTEAVENYTVYILQVTLEQYTWTVRHRYNDFVELNARLVRAFGLDPTLLPPKKMFGNQSKTFIVKRQQELEAYLQAIVQILSEVPEPLAQFLVFDRHEIHGISQALAKDLFLNGEVLLEAKDFFEFNPLQLHAVTERLKLPEPPCESGDKQKDLSHALDIFSRLHYLRITGSNAPVGTSNLVPNHLCFELSRFKNVEHLQVISCKPQMISSIDSLRRSVQVLEVHYSLRCLKEFLLCDVVHSEGFEISPTLAWPKVEAANFRNNQIMNVDESIILLPHLKRLDLSHNCLEVFPVLSHHSSLVYLDLSVNRFSSLQPLHLQLGNITTLLLTGNQIKSLKGFSKLYSLVNLDLSYNWIALITEIENLSSLPCLETLNLAANPVTFTVDYRVRALSLFQDRYSEICLDNEKPTQKELDTVAVLIAIQISRQGRQPKVSGVPLVSEPSDSNIDLDAVDADRITAVTSQ